MTPVEDVARSERAATPAHDQLPAYDSGSHTHILSHSDSDVNMNDMESRQNTEHLSSSSQASTSSQPRSTRRARVDDDDEEEQLRETNRQRMQSPSSNNHEEPQPASAASQALPSQNSDTPPNHPPPPYSRLVYTFDFFPGPPPPPPHADHHAPADAPQDDAHAHHHHHHHHPPPMPMFNFTFQIPLSPPVRGAPGNAEAANDAPPNFPDFTQFFAMPGGQPGFFPFFPFGMHREEEEDDPERAERLIRGLDEVSPGLVQRMERVGGEEGDTCCSICWEKISSEGGGFESDEQASGSEDGTGQNAEETSMELDNPPPAPSIPADGVLTTESAAQLKSKPDLPRVVSLPCAHVFHTACLLPWFTKPHRTTCPSCRFDIDPESLTFVPQRQRRSRRAAQAQGPAPAPAAQQQQPQSQPSAHPAPTQANPVSDAAPNQGQVPRSGFIPNPLGFEFNLFFPGMMGPQPAGGSPATHAGSAPGAGANPGTGAAPGGFQYIPLDAQMTQNLFDRIFGGVASAPQAQAQPSQPQGADGGIPPVQPNVPEGTAPRAPPLFGLPDEQTARTNMFQNLFGRMPPPNLNPGAGHPAAGGPAPQRPPNTAQTGARTQGRPRPAEKRQWTLPAPPGPTLRQRVERRERELGLRCSDVSCGLGPSDEDPIPVVDPCIMRQISIRPLEGSAERVCEHTFHPSCLVSAERVAGWGGEDKKEEKEGEQVEVSCPVCRAVGIISRTDWDEGACALA